MGLMDTGSGGRYRSLPSPSFSPTLHARYAPSEEDYVEVFARLLRLWRYHTLYTSSSDEIFSRPEFRQIVAMGDKVVPLILSEMAQSPDHLIAALPLITGEDPVPAACRGNFEEMARCWNNWYGGRG